MKLYQVPIIRRFSKKSPMSTTYFCFSDETGCYHQYMKKGQVSVHPNYIRTTFIMNSNEWKSLNENFGLLKKNYSIPLNEEIKWSDLWNRKTNKIVKNREFINNYSYETLLNYVDDVFQLFNQLKEKKVSITLTRNKIGFHWREQTMLKIHLQNHIQRVQMELQDEDRGNLGVLFFDTIGEEKDKELRRVYNDLFINGDFIHKYHCIKDSLNFEPSHHSVGIQISDFIGGTFNSLLRCVDKNNYIEGVKMFYEYIYKHLRRDSNGFLSGYGIMIIPNRNIDDKMWVSEKLKLTQGLI